MKTLMRLLCALASWLKSIVPKKL